VLSEELVYRKIKESDQRNYGLYITEKGQTFIHIFHEINTEIPEKVLSNFAEDELKLLFKLTEKMYENTKKL
jgi:DNA-binding MarR family transcriptional regulator